MNHGIKILVIEDEESIRELIIEMLSEGNFTVFSARNGKEGLKLAFEHLPNLIICDIIMPGLNGYRVLEKLRQNSQTLIIPLIFLTAKNSPEDMREGMKLGADDYLTKPFTQEQLLTAINVRLNRSQLIKKSYSKQLEDLRSNITLSLPHELRTPLTGILGSVGFLLAELDSLSKSDIKEMLDYIQDSGQHLYELIQRYLLYIQLQNIAIDESSLIKYRQDTTSFALEIIESFAQEKAKFYHREDDLYLILDNILKDIEINMNYQHFEHLIVELIDNAFKFSYIETPITLKIYNESENLIILISNIGENMTPEQIINIGAFTQFGRYQHEQQGVGLGLAIVEKIIEIYQGKLIIGNETNHETQIKVMLPIVDS